MSEDNNSLGYASALASANMLSDGDASSAAGAGTPTIEYRTLDKSGWGDGPWQAEPDKRQWKDEATGLPCLIVRGPGGHWCGYVGVAPGHPWYGKDYSETHVLPCGDSCFDDWHGDCRPEAAIAVHGGLTFASGCAHGADPAKGVCHIPGEGEPDHVWWFGFDCAHCDDESPGWRRSYAHGTYRDQAYVEAEVRSLAAQLAVLSASPVAVTDGLQARSRDSDGANQ